MDETGLKTGSFVGKKDAEPRRSNYKKTPRFREAFYGGRGKD